VSGTVWDVEATGYEIRHGRIDRDEPLVMKDAVLGTSWHGLLEGDAFRRKLLTWVAERRDREWTAGTTSFAHVREAHLDRLADWFGEHVDAPALLELIHRGAPERLPVIACSAS
jgi:adenosylcobyric acid synthase